MRKPYVILVGSASGIGKSTISAELAKKLEKALNIILIEKISNMELEDFKNKSSGGPTLGDIVKIKRK